MSAEILSTIIIIAFSGLYIVLERAFPYDKGQRILRDGFWTDLVGYGIIQSYLLGLVIHAFIRFLDEGSGLSRLKLVSDWPIWLQCLIFFVVHDFYIYWFHRWQHRSPILWRIHEAHHSVVDVDWMAGTRSHSLEILINQTIEFAPIVLLGAAPEVAIFKGLIDAVWGMYIHSNINVRTGLLQYVINGPEMHRWHHAAITEGHGWNYATKLAVWDWIFDTAHLPAGKKPASYGLAYVPFPKNYFAQHAFAFRRRTSPTSPN